MADPLTPRPAGRPPLTARNNAIIAQVRAGKSKKEVAASFGMKKAALSRILRRYAPELVKEQSPAVDKYEAFARRAATATPCPVCGDWNLRGYQTCSSECATVYGKVGDLLNPAAYNRNRIKQAEWILKNRPNDHRTPWARKIVAAASEDPSRIPPPAHRSYRYGSRRRNVARALGLLPQRPRIRRTNKMLFP